MSASSIIRAAGLAALGAVSGESLRYGGASGAYTPVFGTCHRMTVKMRDGLVAEGQMDFTALGFTNVEIPLTGMAKPEAGKFFVDSIGARHRIKYVSQTDISWFCYCLQSLTQDAQQSPIQLAVSDSQVIPVIENSTVVAWKIKDVTTNQIVTLTIENGQIVLR